MLSPAVIFVRLAETNGLGVRDGKVEWASPDHAQDAVAVLKDGKRSGGVDLRHADTPQEAVQRGALGVSGNLRVAPFPFFQGISR